MILFATSLVNDDHSKVRLVLAGGARNSEDEGRVTDLRNLCKHLAVEDNVEFKARQRPIPPKNFFLSKIRQNSNSNQVNVPFSDLKREMGRAAAGIHTMWNEHFGIGE